MDIYEPAEDSYLLEKEVKLHAQGRVLDLGTGSGIQGLSALKSSRVRDVLSVDINENALAALKEKAKFERKLRTLKSDLFENVTGKFNTIIFNPPYLPQDEGIEDAALYGGKKGWEISARFFEQVSHHLIGDGKILFLFSTLTNKEKIEELIVHNLLEFKELSSLKLSFEKLYVYEIVKSPLLRELEIKLIEDIHYFAKGKRGVIYKGLYHKSSQIKSHLAKKETVVVAIKTKREDSLAIGRIENEINWLKILNKKGIGPKLLFFTNTYFVYEFVEGEFFVDWLLGKDKDQIKKVILDVLNQCYIMDQLGVNKEEMHHPQKHILVTKDGPVMIDTGKSKISGIPKTVKPVLLDFERCSRVEHPKNVTQFVEFLARVKDSLQEFNYTASDLRDFAKEYKRTLNVEIVINAID